MIPDDGGGRRRLRQAPFPRPQRHWADINGETTPANTPRFSTNRRVLACGVTAITASAAQSYTVYTAAGVFCRPNRKRVGSPRSDDPPGSRSRAVAPWGLARSADLVLISHSAGRRARRLRYFRGLGRRARKLLSSLIGRETPYAYGRGHAERPEQCTSAGWELGCESGRTNPDPPAHGRIERPREVCRRHLPWARAEQDTGCTPSARDIVRMPDRPRARSRPKPQRQDKVRSRRGRIWLQLLSVAPVFFDTSATILDIVVSISASVSVRSRGCSVTWMAIDFAPSATRSPR